MSDNLSNFMVDLASDPDRMARFMANPEGELDDSLLTAPERAVVLSRVQVTDEEVAGGGADRPGDGNQHAGASGRRGRSGDHAPGQPQC